MLHWGFGEFYSLVLNGCVSIFVSILHSKSANGK